MNRALVVPSPVTYVHSRAASGISRVLFTFAYALVGDQPQAEELAIEAFDFVVKNGSTDQVHIEAFRRILLAATAKSFEGGFARIEDAPLRTLTCEQRAVVALRRFLRLPLQERLSVLDCGREQEQALWDKAVEVLIRR